MTVTSVRLQTEIEAPLEQLANKLDRSKNYLINQAIKEFISRNSADDEKWQETLSAIDSIKSEGLIDEQSVNQWLDSWGTDKELTPPK